MYAWIAVIQVLVSTNLALTSIQVRVGRRNEHQMKCIGCISGRGTQSEHSAVNSTCVHIYMPALGVYALSPVLGDPYF